MMKKVMLAIVIATTVTMFTGCGGGGNNNSGGGNNNSGGGSQIDFDGDCPTSSPYIKITKQDLIASKRYIPGGYNNSLYGQGWGWIYNFHENNILERTFVYGDGSYDDTREGTYEIVNGAILIDFTGSRSFLYVVSRINTADTWFMTFDSIEGRTCDGYKLNEQWIKK